jgi:hypothetical protein
MAQFDLTNYLNILKGMRFRTQNEFSKAKNWEKNVIKDLKSPFVVPNIILGKKYYIDWTKLEARYTGKSADEHHKMMCSCGIGEIIFEKIGLYKSTFGFTEIKLFGVCATSNGVDKFKIVLCDENEKYNQATISFSSFDSINYNLHSEIYTDKTLKTKILENGVVVNGTKITYNQLASAQLSLLGYNVCEVNGMNTITTCEWNGVEVVAIEPRVVTYNCGFAISIDEVVLYNGYSEDTIETYETRTFPYQSYLECRNKNKVKFTTFGDEDDEEKEKSKEFSFTIVLNGKVKVIDNLYGLNDLLDELKKLIE